MRTTLRNILRATFATAGLLLTIPVLRSESMQYCGPVAVMEQTEMITATRLKSQDAHRNLFPQDAPGCTPPGPTCPHKYYFTRTEHFIKKFDWEHPLHFEESKYEWKVIDTRNRSTNYVGTSFREYETGLYCECEQNPTTGDWDQDPFLCYSGFDINTPMMATLASTCAPDRYFRTGTWIYNWGGGSIDTYYYYHLILYSGFYTDTAFKNKLINSITYNLTSWEEISQTASFYMDETHSYAEAEAFRFRFMVTGGDPDKWYELSYQEVITEVDGKKRSVTKYLTFKGQLGPKYVPSDAGLAFSAPPSTKTDCAASNTTATVELIGIWQITK